MTRPRETGETTEQATNNDSATETMSTTENPTTTETSENCTECASLTRRRFVQGAGATAALAATGAGGAAAQETTTDDGPEWTSGRDGLAWDSEYVQGPYYIADLTKAKHRVSWGTDDDALAFYENDSGEKDTLGGHVDRDDTENVLTARADKIAFPDADAFPRGATYDDDNDSSTEEVPVSALDATHWSTSDSASGTISVSDPGRDVHSLNISTSGVASGETATATFDLSQFNATIDSDEAKRFLQVVGNVNSLASAASVTVAVVDDDGDRKEVFVDSSKSASDDDVLATATGDGLVLQQRLGDLTTNANGDGSFASIQKVVVEVAEADADLTFSALNVEKMSRWVYGSYLANEGTDSEERMKTYEPSGTFEATGLETFSEAFLEEGAVFYDLQYPMRVTLEEGDLAHEWRFVEATDRPGYDSVLQQRGKVELETGYDLSWSSPALKDMVSLPESRYKRVATASGVRDTEFADIEDTSWTTHTSAYDAEGATVTLSDPAATGTVVGYETHVLLTGSDRTNAESSGSSGGGGAGGRGRGSGGDGLIGWLAAGVASVAGFIMGSVKGWW